MSRKRAEHGKNAPKGRPGRVVETVGRRVRVRDEEGERVCFLSGQRAVIGDQVRWVVAKGTGGKLVGVDERRTVLSRLDHKGREQVVAANLDGVVIVDTGAAPPLAPVLLDRYLVAADRGGLRAVICVNKADLGLPDEARDQLAVREALGFRVLHTSAHSGEGIEELRAFIAQLHAQLQGPLPRLQAVRGEQQHAVVHDGPGLEAFEAPHAVAWHGGRAPGALDPGGVPLQVARGQAAAGAPGSGARGGDCSTQETGAACPPQESSPETQLVIPRPETHPVK